jgi:hypothetical protein
MDYGQVIFDTLISQGLPVSLSNLVVSQSKHETNNYTSNVFLHCNNCFGYKWDGQSYSTGACLSSPEGDYYAAYNSVIDSAKEIAAWIYRRQDEGIFPDDLSTITTPTQYATLLKQSQFFTDNLAVYISGLTRWFKLYQVPVLTGLGSLVLIAVGIIAFSAYEKKMNR